MLKAIKTIAVCIVLGFSLLPAGLHVLAAISGSVSRDSGENRSFQQWPKWEDAEGDPARYTKNISGYINDHFGVRTLAIRVKNRLFVELGDQSITVLQGRTAGWYFLNDPVMWDSYKGRLRFGQDDIEAWYTSLKSIRDASVSNGALFAAIIPPDKARIYPEHTPPQYGEPGQESFASVLASDPNFQALGILNAHPAVWDAKEEGAAFFSTDTHWTHRGAFPAYQLVMAHFNSPKARFPVLRTSDLNDEAEDDFSGDLAGLIGLKGAITENVTDVVTPKTKRKYKKSFVETEDIVAEQFKTAIYSDGYKPKTRLVVIGDSFSNALIVYFIHSFDEIVLVHHQMGEFDMDEVLSYEPNAVLFAPVERTAITMRDFGH